MDPIDQFFDFDYSLPNKEVWETITDLKNNYPSAAKFYEVINWKMLNDRLDECAFSIHELINIFEADPSINFKELESKHFAIVDKSFPIIFPQWERINLYDLEKNILEMHFVFSDRVEK